MNRGVILIGAGVGIGLLAKHLMANKDEIGKIEDYRFPSSGKIDRYWGDVKPINYTGRTVQYQSFHMSPEAGAKRFNLRGIEFGNWMNQKDRASHFAAGMEGLNDLASVLRKKPSQLGFNRKLAIAFGARGNPRTAAHYETGSWVINQTKENGKFGSLAHEYGHFIDNIVGSRYHNSKLAYGAGNGIRATTDEDLLNSGSILAEYEKLFDILYWTKDGKPTSFYRQQNARTHYYKLRVEVWARTFEVYCTIRMAELGITNRYLQKAHSSAWPPKELVAKAIPHIEKIIRYAFG